MTSTISFPSLSTTFESIPAEKKVGFFNILPKDHSLCIADYEPEGGLKIGVYVKDPETKIDLLCRDEEAASLEGLYSDFYEDNCKNCEHYYDVKVETEEDEDEEGNTVTTTTRMVSPCHSYSDGLEEVFENCSECEAGYCQPELEDQVEEHQVIQGEYIFNKEKVDSSPLYFEFRYFQSKQVDKVKVALAEAYQLVAPESKEKIYFLTKNMEPFNMYHGTPPGDICFGGNPGPQSRHLEETATIYSSSVFNDDLLTFDAYEDILTTISDIRSDIENANDQDTDEEFTEYINDNLNITRGDGIFFPSKEREEYVVSSDWNSKKADAILITSLHESAELHYRLYSSGVKSVNKFNGFSKPSIYVLYEYTYVNPDNPSQSINGYITEPNTAGYCWFFVDNKITSIVYIGRFEYKSFFYKYSNNIAVCLTQIKP